MILWSVFLGCAFNNLFLLFYLELLWTAPELLSRSERKTKAGDVYSFGIILAEIMSREDPYAETQMDPKGDHCFI